MVQHRAVHADRSAAGFAEEEERLPSMLAAVVHRFLSLRWAQNPSHVRYVEVCLQARDALRRHCCFLAAHWALDSRPPVTHLKETRKAEGVVAGEKFRLVVCVIVPRLT